jgi:hypothetical protein
LYASVSRNLRCMAQTISKVYSQLGKTFVAFKEFESSSPCSQDASTWPHATAIKFGPCFIPYFFKFVLVLSSSLYYSSSNIR